jgi:hypothetical protein
MVSGFRADMGKFAGMVGVAFSATAIVGMGKQLLELSDQMRDAARETGLTVEQVGALKARAEQSGASFDAIVGGLVKMRKAQEDVASGSKSATDAFAKLGISAEEVISLAPDKLLERVAKGAQNSAQATSAMSAIFGKGGFRDLAEVMPDIANGMDQFTEKMSKYTLLTAEAAENFDELRETLVQASQVVLSGLVTGIAKFVAGIKDAASLLGFMFEEGVVQGFKSWKANLDQMAVEKEKAAEAAKQKETDRVKALAKIAADERKKKEEKVRAEFAKKEQEALSKITVDAPVAADRLARMGGMLGGGLSYNVDSAREHAKRSLKIAEVQRELQEKMAEALAKITTNTEPLKEDE